MAENALRLQVQQQSKRIAELEAALALMTSGPPPRQFSFDHEWYLGCLRMEPGDYDVRRVGPAREMTPEF